MKSESELKQGFYTSAQSAEVLECSRQNVLSVANRHSIEIYRAAPNFFWYAKKGINDYSKKRKEINNS